MGREIPVKVANEELKEWKSLFNDTENWGIKSRFARENKKGVTLNTLNWVLLRGSGYPTTVNEIRKFFNKERKKLLPDEREKILMK